MSIKFLKHDKFKGLNQSFNPSEMPPGYCHRLKNIDVDDPLDKMRVRDGYSKFINTAMTDVQNAYEYYYKDPDETKLFINDNGSIKISTDSGAIGSAETLPTGATIESGFKCQFMGYKNHVIMTTGNGATNYVLGYYYVDREIDDDKGLFGNVEEKTGYMWDKSSLIPPNGQFNNVYDVATLGDYYYFCFSNSKYIEKRDSNFHLIERRTVETDEATTASLANTTPTLCSDGTYLYVAYNTSATDIAVEKINPLGYKQEAIYTNDSAGTDRAVAGICVDSANAYLLCSGTDYIILEIETTGMTLADSDNGSITSDVIDICCDDTADTGYFYVLIRDAAATADALQKRAKNGLAQDSIDTDEDVDFEHCEYDNVNDYIYISTKEGNGIIYRFTTTIATAPVQYAFHEEPSAFVIIGTALNCISTRYGTLHDVGDITRDYPSLFSLTLQSTSGSGNLDAGTYFYKFSIVDSDDQEYTLSDPIIYQNTLGTLDHNLCLAAVITGGSTLNDPFYRVDHINIYRGYSSLGNDEELPETDYKFLKKIEINSSQWVDDKSNNRVYYYDFIDDQDEDEISDVTFFENSGIGDAVKPRYVNGKYLTWLDNQLHLANFSHDGDTYTNRIVRSSTNAPDAISFYDPYNFDVSEGDVIKGITNLFGRAVVFKSRKMATFYDGSQEREFIEGLSGENGYFAKDDAVFYISDKGLHVFDGNRVHNLTDSVRYYFELDTDLDTVSVFYFDNKDRVVFSIHSATNQRTLVYNLKYKTWTYYDLAFKGFFKNNGNEYIAYRKTGGATTDYLCKLFDGSTKDLEDVGGASGGTAISIEYQSPLFKTSEIDGVNSMLLGYWWRGICSGTLSILLYKYKTTGKTLIDTYTISSPTGNSAVKNHHLPSEWGESYAITISGTTPTTPASQEASFEFHSITYKIKQLGMVDAV